MPPPPPDDFHTMLLKLCNAMTAALLEKETQMQTLTRERDEARAGRDFFDAERMKVVEQLTAAEAQRDEWKKCYEMASARPG